MTMRKKISIVLVVLSVIVLSYFLLKNFSTEEKYFKNVSLSQNNTISLSSSVPNYYDTIISVGLDVSGIKGHTIMVDELSETAKGNFGGELKAHVRYFNGIFYVFIDKLRREEAILVLSHEIAHIEQYISGRFVYENGSSYWDDEKYDLKDLEYDERPWEIDAYNKEKDISLETSKILLQ